MMHDHFDTRFHAYNQTNFQKMLILEKNWEN